MIEVKLKRTLQGVVVSDKMDKAFVVLTERKVKHPKYGKYLKRSKKIHAQDIGNSAHLGDTVIIEECSPVSKTISWKLKQVVEKAK